VGTEARQPPGWVVTRWQPAAAEPGGRRDLASVYRLARDLARDLARILARDLALTGERVPGSDLDLAFGLLFDSRAHRDRDRNVDRDLAHARDPARTVHLRLVQAGSRLSGLRHDFSGEDLHLVDLTGVVLEGVRWDEATRWPPPWQDRIRASSTQHPDGGWQIGRGGTSRDPLAHTRA
jgi:hypothetical protein